MYPYKSALLVDQYQLTMMDAYLQQGMTQTAVFELFARRLPQNRNFLIAAGLEQVLEFLENLRFSPEELDWLAKSGCYSPTLLEYLENFRFRGDVDAVPEGTIVFPDEPVLQISASLPEAQFIETRLINLIHFQTLVASKAVRSVMTAPSKVFIDFGLRRAHGYEAGLLAARASYIGGFTGTATVLADYFYGIPAFGTMAHSYVEAHENEKTAFRHFAETHPKNVIFLLDTYDTCKAAHKVCELAPELLKKGITIQGVRLDSGDLSEQAHQVRKILDAAGLTSVSIMASGNLDEEKIAKLMSTHAPLDGFGVGTHLTTSTDAPYLDYVYKLQEYAGVPKRKKSVGKATWPGRKQVYRYRDSHGIFLQDRVALKSEPAEGGQPLLEPVMRDGKRVSPPVSVHQMRQKVLGHLEELPPSLKGLESVKPYPVHISDELQRLAAELDRNLH